MSASPSDVAPTGSTGPVLLADPRVSAIPVVEDGSPLVDLAGVGLRVSSQPPPPPPGLGLPPTSTDPVPGARPGSHRLVRRTLAERLAEAETLLPDALRLLVVEGLRPVGTQRMIHAAYRARLATERPGIATHALDRLTSRFVAPPATAPHVSGAAVDVTLADGDGRPLDLGCPVDATPEESGGACYFDAPGLDDEARHLRRVLACALVPAGLVNYPTEWWHWSFGDRYWAHVTGSPFAVHGPVAAPDHASDAAATLSPRARPGGG
ncbi:M15 family metallopeptidase [Terrabacter sp. 2TAF16]|jgi:D-alanyl-D-alanine dipeptidase|uniref:M15 family metallopeptidase n=1 Tax=Terrabacter sp. 2TAF16 TaxID=3233008 RepID=UPI003F99D7E4